MKEPAAGGPQHDSCTQFGGKNGKATQGGPAVCGSLSGRLFRAAVRMICVETRGSDQTDNGESGVQGEFQQHHGPDFRRWLGRCSLPQTQPRCRPDRISSSFAGGGPERTLCQCSEGEACRLRPHPGIRCWSVIVTYLLTRLSISWMPAGPTRITKIPGKMNRTSGKIIFTAAPWAFSSAIWRRLVRILSDCTRSA